jgi:hypothetical protein
VNAIPHLQLWVKEQMSLGFNKKAAWAAIAVLLGVSITPVIPISSLRLNDPKNVSDSRIKARITDDDLTEILASIRGGKSCVPPYSVLLNQIGVTESLYPLLSVNDQSDELGVFVKTGYQPSPLGGSGCWYRLTKQQRHWKIIDSGHWLS